MAERERERERQKPASAEARANAMQTAIDSGKAVADISADERFYARSVRIRRLIMGWMVDNVNQRFDSMGEMEAQAANYAKASMVTARRGISQFTHPARPCWMQDPPAFYILRERPQ